MAAIRAYAYNIDYTNSRPTIYKLKSKIDSTNSVLQSTQQGESFSPSLTHKQDYIK